MSQRNVEGYLKRISGQPCGKDIELQKEELIAECPDFYIECYVVHQVRCYERILRYLNMADCMDSTLGQYFTWEWN